MQQAFKSSRFAASFQGIITLGSAFFAL